MSKRPTSPFIQSIEKHLEDKGLKYFLSELVPLFHAYADGFHDEEDIEEVQEATVKIAGIASRLPEGL